MARTNRNNSFKKDKDNRSVYTRYKSNGIKQRQELKESLRTYKNPEHLQYDSIVEEGLDNEHEFDQHCDWENRLFKSIIHNGWDASQWQEARYMPNECSLLHELSFVKGIMDSTNNDEQVCVWKEQD
jgi:hypothetical protein